MASVNQICEKLIKNKFVKYDNVSNSFSKFLYHEDVGIQLEGKANRLDLEDLQNQKASNNDLANINLKIDNLNERVKHISVIQN